MTPEGSPQPVEVLNADPISVEVAQPTDAVEARKAHASAQVDADILRTEDQRRISGIWERTQQIIALSVIEVALAVAGYKAIAGTAGGASQTEALAAFLFLSSVANLVIGFYFGRTNHQRVGGVGSDEIVGR